MLKTVGASRNQRVKHLCIYITYYTGTSIENRDQTYGKLDDLTLAHRV
jgi:hypothetical protein